MQNQKEFNTRLSQELQPIEQEIHTFTKEFAQTQLKQRDQKSVSSMKKVTNYC